MLATTAGIRQIKRSSASTSSREEPRAANKYERFLQDPSYYFNSSSQLKSKEGLLMQRGQGEQEQLQCIQETAPPHQDPSAPR